MPTLRTVSAAAVLLAVLAASPSGGPDYSDWGVPVSLGEVVNSPSNDFGPAASKDGLTLYFTSDRAGGAGSNDIWVTQRESVNDPWGVPANLIGINTASIEGAPVLSRDEHWMFFNSNRAGGFGNNDIWASYREHTQDPFDWQTPVNLGAGVNTAFLDQGASYLENEGGGAPLLFFSSDRPGGPGLSDMYVSERLPDGTFGPALLVPELSSPLADFRPSVRFDGLEMIFYSNRPGGFGITDLWASTRATVFEPWAAPVNLGPLVNGAFSEQNPHLAADRRTLYLASNRPGTLGGLDLYASTRTRQHP